MSRRFNALVFQVDDLAPYKKALDMTGTAFLERQTPGVVGGNASCALWVSLPGTEQALNLVARVGCDATATPMFDACLAS